MKLKEYLVIHEAALQAILSGGFKPVGTFEKQYGANAEMIASMLGSKPTDLAYVMQGENAQQKAAVASVLMLPAKETKNGITLVQLAGGRRVVHDGGHIIVSKRHIDDFIK